MINLEKKEKLINIVTNWSEWKIAKKKEFFKVWILMGGFSVGVWTRWPV